MREVIGVLRSNRDTHRPAWPKPWPNRMHELRTPQSRNRVSSRFRDGETRTRTGDTTIFSQLAGSLLRRETPAN
jgi:hypothetical protein